MSISIKLVQRTDKINNQNNAPINVRFTRNGKSRYISTGVTIPISAWNAENQQINVDYQNSKELQFQIIASRAELEKKVKRLEALDIEVNFESLFGTKSKHINCTIADYFKQQVEQMKSIGKVGTASKYRYCLKLLSQCNSVNIRFEQVNMEYLRKLEVYLIAKGNTSNSIASKFSVLKAVYNRAISDGVFTPNENPFSKFKVGKYWKSTRKRAICKEEILKLKALELSQEDSSFYLRFARDIFLFSYYTAGINFKDIAMLKWSDIDKNRIYYQRHKTSKEMSCQIISEAQQIIERYCSPFYENNDYIFPILNRQTHKTEQQICDRVHKVLGKVNTNLKLISEMIGLKTPLTTYVARHTFATVLKRSGVNIAIISESLGHSDLATTQIYLDSFENSQIDEAMKNLL